MTILVTGATGAVSSALVDKLARDGAAVRVLVRDASRWSGPEGVEVAQGDLDQPESLPAAFEGVDTLWLLTAMGAMAPHRSMNAVWAARHAGVKHVVRMSAIGGSFDAPTRNGRLHSLSDEELKRWGIPYTIIKPAFFMQNLAGSVNGDTLYWPLGPGRIAMIDVDDIAEFAAVVLQNPGEHDGRTYTITGPAAISLYDAAETLSEVTGTAIHYEPVSAQAAHEGMLASGMDPWMAAVNIEYANAYSDDWGNYTTPDFEDVVGRPARSFATFARDNLQLLGAAGVLH
jgi:uncharacterized protein YbjT (DUF2867 family)